MSCWSAAFSEPAKLKAPVSTYAPITKVEGFSDQGWPSVPPLELDLASLFGAKNHLAGPRAVPASKHDQLLTRLTDRAHQCAFQTGAAGNNIALLAFGVSKMMEELEAPEESKAVITKTADAILNLCAAVLTGSARIAAWQTLIQRAIWLKALPSIPEHLQREMLDGPITTDVLFGPHLRGVIERAQKTAELSATVRDLVHPRSASHSGHSARGWDERRGSFRRPAAPPAPRSRPPASAPHQRDQRDGGQRFRRGQQTPSWQSQVQEPRRKQPRK
nr:uncharacterized protein LOC129162054 [Nothobranchius furzeri]XP_054594533.1 uncharacterized protein LOC129162054 [Nothobranchius furzeri]